MPPSVSTATSTSAPAMATPGSATPSSSPANMIPSPSAATAVTSIRRRKARFFLFNILHYIASAYAYVCTIFHMQQRQPQQQQHPRVGLLKRQPTTTRNTVQPPATKSSPTPHIAPPIPRTIQNPKALQYYKGKTLVLDLDETLVHSVRLGSPEAKSSVSTSIKRKQIEVTSDKQSLLYVVYKRPHVDFFLRTISQWYKVVIYTASMPEYADPVIDWLDQDGNMVSQRYFRQSCVVCDDGNFQKDITLAEPNLAKVCLVDNSMSAFGLYQENAIPLPGWISNPNDECLLDLLPLLDALRFTADVRSILRLRRVDVS